MDSKPTNEDSIAPMYQIVAPKRYLFSADPERAIGLGEVKSIINQADRNKHKVIEAGTIIEGLLADLIAHHFHGNQFEAREEFKGIVLESDWCTFRAKRILADHVVGKRKLLAGDERSRFQKALKDTNAFRNAFTHGTMTMEKGVVALSYFEGAPRKETLDLQFLKRVESAILEAFDLGVKCVTGIGCWKTGDLNETNIGDLPNAPRPQ